MVNLTIDNINVSVPEGTTIMDAAKMADIPIPKLCYLKDIKCDPSHVDNDNWFMRQGGGALASFNEITVTEMTITISSKYATMSEDLDTEDNYAIRVSEIYVTGKEA